MLHDTELIGTLTGGLVLAFVFGFAATKLRLPPIVGYLIAGIAIGPFTPGFVGDTELAPQLAEIGVILLMFGVGIHFSVKDLLSVKNIAIPGAIGQSAGATLLATLSAVAWGMPWGEGIVLGLAISVASTVVLLRALEDRHALTSTEGRIAVGWLIVEDLFTVFALVMLPVMATSLGGSSSSDGSGNSFLVELGLAAGKLALLIAVMFFIGARVIPWLLLQVARTGSRELFTLSVLATALGIAFASAYFFDASLALGAFFAGLVVGQSAQSHQAAADALPLRDAFAVLFFVSVGMLFDPEILIDEPGKLAWLIAIIILGKSIIAFGIVIAFKQAVRTALVVAAALAQIGEFSFILADMGRSLDLVSDETNNLILGAALISITLNPVMFMLVGVTERWLERHDRTRSILTRSAAPVPIERMTEHAVVCGGGTVGQLIATALAKHNIPYVVFERDQRRVDDAVSRGIRAEWGDSTKRAVLENAHLETARLLVVATPDSADSQQIVSFGRMLNPNLTIVSRTRRPSEVDDLLHEGVAAEDVVVNDVEVGLTLIRRSLNRLGISDADALQTLRTIRQHSELSVDEDDDAYGSPYAIRA
jgi:CPA2 family monovalent cation:H+ antiporter-2